MNDERRAVTDRQEVVFYDGSCAMCHGFVRFVASRDPVGQFHFAPIGGPRFEAAISAAERAKLPDTVIVSTADGRLLLRSRAVLYVLARLGGAWWVLGKLAWLVPVFIRDLVYDAIARVRRRWFGTATKACPVVPPSLRGRFEA